MHFFSEPHLPSNIHFTKITSDSLTLKWEQPTGDLSGYLIEYEPVSTPKVFEEEAKGTGGKTETTQEEGGTSKEEEEDGTKKQESDNSKKEEVFLEAKKEEVELIGLTPGHLYCITLCSKSQSEMGEIHTLEQYTSKLKIAAIFLPSLLGRNWSITFYFSVSHSFVREILV